MPRTPKNVGTIFFRSVIVVFVVAAVLGLGIIFYAHHDGHMHFPAKSAGVFVERPHLIGGGDSRAVRWVFLKDCGGPGYEAVTGDYVEGKPPTAWFGSSATCHVLKNGNTECTELLKERIDEYLLKGQDVWFVVRSSTCNTDPKYSEFDKLIIPSGAAL